MKKQEKSNQSETKKVKPNQNDPLIKLSDSIGNADSITLVLGLSFITLASFYIGGFIDLKTPYFVGLTVSGAIFALIDYLILDRGKNRKVAFYTYFLLTFLGMSFIIIIPNLKFVIDLEEGILNKFSNAATLLSMGLVITTIAMRNKNSMSESFRVHLQDLNKEISEKAQLLKSLTSEFEKVKEEHNDIKKDYQKTKEDLERTKKEFANTQKSLEDTQRSLTEAETKIKQIPDNMRE